MNLIMIFAGIVLLFLFLFLLFILIAVIIGSFKKKTYESFEPEISIIIPCFNEEKNIEKTIRSIYNSDYKKELREIIVVDDGSIDNTQKILKRLRNENKELKIIFGKHSGKSASLNLGLKVAKHEIIICIDSDTVLEENAISKIVLPLKNKSVGATNGTCIVGNRKKILESFQHIEYVYNNLIRKAFSSTFNNGVWFFGFFAAYKKSILKKIGGFKLNSLTEDMDIALEINKEGYKLLQVYDAVGYTQVPKTLKEFFKQRIRWWYGVLQSLRNHRDMLTRKTNGSILFLFINQYWWTFYSIVSLPIIIYQYNFWLKTNIETIYIWFLYTFRWFSLFGSIHVLYKIPEWGVSFYSIFGVLSGILTAGLIIYAFKIFKQRWTLKYVILLIIYFPYTILINLTVFAALIFGPFKKKYFVK